MVEEGIAPVVAQMSFEDALVEADYGDVEVIHDDGFSDDAAG